MAHLDPNVSGAPDVQSWWSKHGQLISRLECHSAETMQPDSLKAAYEGATGAELQCNSWNEGCAGGNCANWGLPFIHSSHFGDKLCWGGDEAAPCDKVPVDGHHRRLCPCEVA